MFDSELQQNMLKVGHEKVWVDSSTNQQCWPLCYRDNYGFVTFNYTCDAFAAIESKYLSFNSKYKLHQRYILLYGFFEEILYIYRLISHLCSKNRWRILLHTVFTVYCSVNFWGIYMYERSIMQVLDSTDTNHNSLCFLVHLGMFTVTYKK